MTLPNPLPNLDALFQRFTYNPETGVLHRRTRDGLKPIGANNGHGYLKVRVRSGTGASTALVHRVAWKMYYGREPGPVLDHIDRTPLNNRISNLREVSHLESVLNRGLFLERFQGFFTDKSRPGFRVRMSIGGTTRQLGTFPTEVEARAAYLGAIRALEEAGVRPAPFRNEEAA